MSAPNSASPAHNTVQANAPCLEIYTYTPATRSTVMCPASAMTPGQLTVTPRESPSCSLMRMPNKVFRRKSNAHWILPQSLITLNFWAQSTCAPRTHRNWLTGSPVVSPRAARSITCNCWRPTTGFHWAYWIPPARKSNHLPAPWVTVMPRIRRAGSVFKPPPRRTMTAAVSAASPPLSATNTPTRPIFPTCTAMSFSVTSR